MEITNLKTASPTVNHVGMLYKQPSPLISYKSIPNRIQYPHLTPNELLETFRSLDALPKQLDESSLLFDPIDHKTIDLAKQFIVQLMNLINQEGLIWVAPRVTTDGDGDVSFEWWRREHLLQITIEPSGHVETLSAWGPHIWQDMKSGSEPSERDLVELWTWLYN